MNLSNKSLSQVQIKLLDKGLNFIPTPPKIDEDNMLKSVKEVGRRIKLAFFFQHNLREQFRHKIKFRKKSTWSPPDKLIHESVRNKIIEMESEIKSIRVLKENPNLKKAELKALKQQYNYQASR